MRRALTYKLGELSLPTDCQHKFATLLHTLCNYAIFLAAAGIVLRLAFICSPDTPESRARGGGGVRLKGQA
jgi:hypothetical protein